MSGIIFRTLPLVLALVHLIGAHGTEIVSAATTPTRSDCHDCGCATECACRGPVKGCNCSAEGVSLKTACGCGCSDGMHMAQGSSFKSLLVRSCAMGAPNLIWSRAADPGDPEAWRLAHEHEHPPRLLS